MEVLPLHFCDVTVEGELWPVYGWAIDRPEGTILVDTGMIDSTPELDREWGPRLRPWPELGNVTAVINTHLHFDHCGGNRRFAGTPTYVQRIELESALAPDYLEEWVRFQGATYVEIDGDADLFDGVSVLFTPGHSAGHQAVVVDADDGLVVLGGDVTHSMRELIDGATPSIMRIHDLKPVRVYLAHDEKPWVPVYD
ncbi:MAG TPA: MBL fold metallo-hydrolase [Gaiellaceae bacterium]|nr:MBL fold metallo-hydrolase [Gaiellaceae bacterium]